MGRAIVVFTSVIACAFVSLPAQASGDPIPVCLSAQGTLRIVGFQAGCGNGESKLLLAGWEAEIEEAPEVEEEPASQASEQQVRALSKQVQELTARLAALERNAREAQSAPATGELKPVRATPAAHVTAPFEVVSRSGAVILRVAEKISSSGGDGAHVTIGAGDHGNYSVRVHKGGQQLVAGIGQTREGAGLVVTMDSQGVVAAHMNGRDRRISVYDGEHAAASMAAEKRGGTIAVYDGAEAVAYLTRSSHGQGGNLTLATSSGFGVFSAGAASDGGGEACLNRVTGGGQQRNVCLGVELPSMGLGK